MEIYQVLRQLPVLNLQRSGFRHYLIPSSSSVIILNSSRLSLHHSVAALRQICSTSKVFASLIKDFVTFFDFLCGGFSLSFGFYLNHICFVDPFLSLTFIRKSGKYQWTLPSRVIDMGCKTLHSPAFYNILIQVTPSTEFSLPTTSTYNVIWIPLILFGE